MVEIKELKVPPIDKDLLEFIKLVQEEIQKAFFVPEKYLRDKRKELECYELEKQKIHHSVR